MRSESSVFVTDLSPWYRVSTKVIFKAKGSYGYRETRNVFRQSVQYPYLPVRAVIIPRLEGGSIGPSTESFGKWDVPMAMVPCLHQENIYTKRKLRVYTDQKCIPLVGAITPLTCAGRQNTLSRGRQDRSQYGKLHKL